jgi:hypothetical protein
MTNIKSRHIAWGLVIIVFLSILGQLFFWLRQLTAQPTLYDLVQILGWAVVGPIIYAIVGALIINRQPGNRVGWLMMLIALTSVNPISTYVDTLVESPATITPFLWLVLWIDGWSWIPAIFPIFLIPLHFPTGRPHSPRWGWVNRFAIALWVIFITLVSFSETIGPLEETWVAPNPIGFISFDQFWGLFINLWGIGLILTVLAGVMSLFIRYRQAKSVERQQIKWLLFGGSFFALYFVFSFYFNDESRQIWWIDLMFISSILTIPIAIAIAILRYRLYDIDIIIRRTAVYASLTAALGLIYFGSVVVLQTVVGRATAEQSPLVIVFSTLLIAALFSPLRRRIQSFIDRRFYRNKYDAAQMLAQFAVAARDEVDMETLSAALLRVVEQTMQPEQTSLWLQPSKGVRKT